MCVSSKLHPLPTMQSTLAPASLLSSLLSSAAGSVCNVVLMRNSELKTGIEVFDEKGEAVGTSKVAAKKVNQGVYKDALYCILIALYW